MSRDRRKAGQKGEDAAVRFLEKEGYEILDRNYRRSVGEIDIIARKDGRVIFVEVKSRFHGNGFGEPEQRVDIRKQRKIGKTALYYLQEKEWEMPDCRFDVIAVTEESGKTAVKHIEDAFWLNPDLTET